MDNPLIPASNNLEILLIGIGFMSIVFLIAFIRNMESRRIRSKYQQNEILLSSFGVQFYGVESVPGKPLRSTGTLVMTQKELYYRAKFMNRELTIPGEAISSLSVIDTFKGKLMYVKVIAVNFINSDGERDRAVFRIPYPERWNAAIRKVYLSRNEPANIKPGQE